jgi:hypothetical protein
MNPQAAEPPTLATAQIPHPAGLPAQPKIAKAAAGKSLAPKKRWLAMANAAKAEVQGKRQIRNAKYRKKLKIAIKDDPDGKLAKAAKLRNESRNERRNEKNRKARK